VNALLTGFKELAAGLRQGRALVQVAHEFQDVFALKVALAGDAVGGHEGICFVAEYGSDLDGCPDKELAFHAFAVGVLGAIRPSGRIKHFADNIVQDLLRDGAEELVARDLPGVEIHAGQL
jgi:hypothetical protein